MKLYIIRHGETPWNAEKRLQGHSDIDISEQGIRLAELTGEALADVPFDLAISSPLVRARHTAECVLGDRNLPIQTDERLIEISFGEYEGMKYRSFEREVPDPEFQNFFDAPEKYHTPPGGESLDELEARTGAFMKDICSRKELEDETILISTHGCALRGLLNSLRKCERKDYWNGKVAKNCAVSIVESHDGIARLVTENKIFYKE